VAVDLKISEIVDAPNWIVSAYLPLSIFKTYYKLDAFDG
jgi:acetamidase/formamidase